MKTPPKKSAAIAAILGLAVVAGFTLAQAQETTASGTTPLADSIVAIAADSQLLPQVAPAQVPVRGGTFWWVYPGGLAVPTPMLPLDSGAAIYGVAPDEYLVDLTGGTLLVTPHQLEQAAQGSPNAYAAAVTAQVQGLINLITWVQTPTPTVAATTTTTANAPSLQASPLNGGGGFSPMDQTQSGVPYLTIAPTATNGILDITVWNDQGPANYDLWWTPALANPQYPWQWIAVGDTGQTNFIVNTSYPTAFFRAVWDTNSIPLWKAADPNNQSTGVLTVFIDSPANGAVLQ